MLGLTATSNALTTVWPSFASLLRQGRLQAAAFVRRERIGGFAPAKIALLGIAFSEEEQE
jgi:hypothetical protein